MKQSREMERVGVITLASSEEVALNGDPDDRPRGQQEQEGPWGWHVASEELAGVGSMATVRGLDFPLQF